MMKDENLRHKERELICDEEWIVGQAKASHADNAHTARAWLITGKTLFPQSFLVQFEAYNIEKSVSNTR